MRIFAATSTREATKRTAVPVEILRRLAFGRPERRAIQPAQAPVAVAVPVALPVEAAVTAVRVEDWGDLDQRVRQSGEW